MKTTKQIGLSMDMNKRRSVLKAGALAAAGTMLGVPLIVRAQPAVVKLGAVGSITGPLSYTGTQARKGIQFALDHINAAGGIKSLGGAKVEMVFVDAQSRPDIGAAEVDKLAQAGVAAIVGAQSSAISLSTSQAAARYGIPYIVDVGSAEQIVERGLKNTFRFSPGVIRSVEQSMLNLNSMNTAANQAVRTAAIVHEDGPFGSSMAKILSEKLPDIGIEVVETISHPTPQRDFTNIVLRLRASGADMVMPSHYINEFILFSRAIQQQKLKLKAMYSIYGGGASNIRFVREHNAAAQYVIDTNHWFDPKKPMSQKLAEQAAAENVDLTYDVMVAYAATQLAVDAIERANSVDHAKIIETLATQTFSDTIMPYGPIKFVNGDNTGSQLVNTQVRGDKIELVYPKEFATAEPVFPMPERG